jgi:opacity protein-like surface antigen
MTKNKLHLGVALATLTMATALVSPQAAAKHKVAKHKAVATYAAPSKTDLMEAQLRAMQNEIASLRAQVNSTAPVTAVDAQKVQELDARMATVETTSTKLIQKEKRKDNMVFFRGGYQYYEKQRQGGTLPAVNGTNALSGNDAWYVGAGFDFSLADDLWGAMHGTEVLAELMFDYKQVGTKAVNGLATTQLATVNQFTLAASPKVKFLKGSAFRPWLIPVGLEVNVVSPPSSAITVLNPGMQFGAGADYNLWKNLYLGGDVRYHYAPGTVDGVNTNGVSAGGYLGIGF